MAYQENPNFPNNPVDPLPVNDSQVRNLDNQKIIDQLEAIENKIPTINDPGLPVSFFANIEEIDLPAGQTVNLTNQVANFFTVDNQQEGDTGEVIVTVSHNSGTTDITIKAGVIFNFPQQPNFAFEINSIENTGGDDKKLLLTRAVL